MCCAKHAFWRSEADARTQKITVEFSVVIVARVILFLCGMLFIACKIFNGSLAIKPVKRANR